MCCSKSYPSRYEIRVFTLLSHVCTGPEGSKHKTIKHYQSDRFTLPGKKAGRRHTKKFFTLWKQRVIFHHLIPLGSTPTYWQAHWPHGTNLSAHSLLVFHPTTPVFLPASLSASSFLRTLSCALYRTGNANLLSHQPGLPDKLTHPILISPQKFSDVCWPAGLRTPVKLKWHVNSSMWLLFPSKQYLDL